ncbi:MAG: hypothetical protein P4L86_16100, partial [Mycobacterium sp.]|nr:hypothetical protein [Mycobacterium sp.]
AGGFDLHSACAVAGSEDLDEYAILEVLDALVRKSLLVADRSAGRTRFAMLETIRQFAEDQLVAGGAATEVRAAHSRYFAGRGADIMALWDSPRQREAYDWFTVELANLRTAFRWAADQGDLDAAAAIATYGGWLGVGVQIYEPIAWAEELIEPAGAVDHPRLAFLYVMVSLCYMTGRIEAAVRYCDAGQIVLGRSREALPYGIEVALGVAYLAIGQPERLAEWCRTQLARRRDTHVYIRGWLVAALSVAGSGGEAMDSADGLIEAAEATGNPLFLGWALGAYGVAFRDADPVGALNALGRGLVIAQDSGNRSRASILAAALADLRPSTATPCPRSITSLWQSATTTMRATPRRSASRWPASPLFSTGSDATNRQPPSPGSPSVPSPQRESPRSPPRSPTSAMSSARRPTNRSPARVRR